MNRGKRVAIIQYAGDYREALQRLSNGGSETYFAQRYSISSVAALREEVEELAVIICRTETPYDEVLANGVRAIGLGFHDDINTTALLRHVEDFRPTELIICTPMRTLFSWAKKQRIRTLGLLADSFSSVNLRHRIRNFQMSRVLNDRSVQWVANHNINSSRSLQEIGVAADKIIPWDWIPRATPYDFESKDAPDQSERFTLLFAGALVEDKGVGDLLCAVAELRHRGKLVQARLAGKGNLEKFQKLAQDLNIVPQVEFLGVVPNEHMVGLMRTASAVVVPSRHSYAEGLPMTIYEGLCSRTPIVASDHPMFRGRLIDRQSALIFRAAFASDLAAKIETLSRDAKLYRRLSEASAGAWERIQIPVKFGELLARWVKDSPENQDWLYSHRLSSGRYADALAAHQSP